MKKTTKYLVVCASKYGSTMQTGRWIGERLEGETTVVSADDETSPENADAVLLGSGVYSHTVLPSIKKYVERFMTELKQKPTAVFGVASDTTGVFVRGKVHGGWDYILPLIEMLPQPPVHAALLGGEINPLKLDEKDRKGLEKFYKMIGQSGEIPFKTKMTKQGAWEFAEKLMQRLAGGGNKHP
jgi:menaquinone-dependent protoporphyrinogen IX oxidase